MRVAIWGRKKEGAYLKQELETGGVDSVSCFIDSSFNEEYDNALKCRVISPIRAIDEYRNTFDKIVLAMRNGTSISYCMDFLKSNRITDFGVLKLSAFDFVRPINTLSCGEVIWGGVDELLLFALF